MLVPRPEPVVSGCGPISGALFSFAKNSRCFLALLFIVFYDHLYSSILYWFADAAAAAAEEEEQSLLHARTPSERINTDTHRHTNTEGNEFWCLDSTLPVALPIRKQHLTNLWAIKTAAEMLSCSPCSRNGTRGQQKRQLEGQLGWAGATKVPQFLITFVIVFMLLAYLLILCCFIF